MKNTIAVSLVVAALIAIQIFSAPQMASAAFIPSNGQAASVVLGQPDFVSNASAATQSGMDLPTGVAVDPTTGKIFVADADNNRVLRFASLAALNNGAAAEGVLGQANFVSELPNRGGAVSAGGMDNPFNLSVDSAGRLWVADTSNNRVLRFDNAATKVNGSNADGVLGQPNFNSHTPAAARNRMYQPIGVYADGARVWFSEFGNNRVLRFDNAAAKSNGADADGVLGQSNFTSNVAAITRNRLDSPMGLFVDLNGRLWVADYSNDRVLRFDQAASKANGADANGVLGQASFTTNASACTQNRMANPRGVSGDPTGRLYVMDTNNNRALIFENAAGLANGANASGVLGQVDLNSCSNGISATNLNNPSSGFYDEKAQVLWLADWLNNRVLMYGNSAPTATLVLGQADFVSLTPAATQTGMDYPHDVAVDPTSGKVFVAEQLNHRVLRFASSSALRNGAAAEAVLGQANFTSGLANRGGAVGADTMNAPVGAHVDAYGRLWVADLSNHRVLRFDNAAAKANGANADGVLGQPDFNSNTSGTTQNQMNQPADVYLDLDGVLWVSDYSNHRVLSFYNAANKPDGGNADKVLGQLDFTSNLAATTRNGMNHPIGLFVDADGRLWVAEFSNHRVLRFDQAGSKANGDNADGVLGQPNFTSGASGCSRTKMYLPRGVGGGPEGRLYVADTANNRVLFFENAAALSNGANASGLLGQPVFGTCHINTGGISQLSLNAPSRVSYDPITGFLWIADLENNRVLRYGINLFLPMVRK